MTSDLVRSATFPVMPAQAGISRKIPAYAGMTPRRASGLALLVLCNLLAACPGGGSNEIMPGVRVRFAEIHMEAQDSAVHDATAASAKQTEPASPAPEPAADFKAGYDHDFDHHHVSDKNGSGFAMYRIYLVLDQLQLVQCPSLARGPGLLLNGLLGVADAHEGGGPEPVGGRALDKPNVIDLLAQDNTTLALGDAAIQPGRYCGARVSLVRLAGDAYGKPAFVADEGDPPAPGHPDMAGKAFAIKADYCSQHGVPTEVLPNGPCVELSTVDVDDGGTIIPAFLERSFDHPLVLTSANREGHVRLGIAYGDWVHDVDITKLGSDAAERQKLLDNILESIHLHAVGRGAPPADPEHSEAQP